MTTHKPHGDNQKPGEFEKNLKEHLDNAKSTFRDIKHHGKVDFKKELANAFEIIKLNRSKMREVADNKSASFVSIIFIALSSLAVYFGLYLSIFRQLSFIGVKFPIGDFLISAVLYFVLYVLMVFVFDFTANHFFKGKGDFGQLLRVLGYGNLVTVAGLIAFLGPFAAIWSLVVSFIGMQEIKKMDTVNIILTILIGGVVIGVLSYILGLIVGYNPMAVYSVSSYLN